VNVALAEMLPVVTGVCVKAKRISASQGPGPTPMPVAHVPGDHNPSATMFTKPGLFIGSVIDVLGACPRNPRDSGNK
jgi:hypothetical protein